MAETESAPALSIGDMAPPLAVSRFVQGEPYEALAPGRVHLIEFWNVGCGPCVEAIPHLTELSREYPAVNFLGMDVLEINPEGVAPLIEKMGDRFAFPVALDRVPDGAPPKEGAMVQTWLKAAFRTGDRPTSVDIPCTFVIDAQGRLAWIGDPRQKELPSVLEQVQAGTWDMAAAATKHREHVAFNQDLSDFYNARRAAEEAGDWQGLVEAIDAYVAKRPDMRKEYALDRVRALLYAASPDADAAGEALFTEWSGSARMLAWIAHRLANARKPAAERNVPAAAAALALKAARRACEMTDGQGDGAAEGLAAALLASGDIDGAIAAQEKAAAVAEAEDPSGDYFDPDEAPRQRARLEEYRRIRADRGL